MGGYYQIPNDACKDDFEKRFAEIFGSSFKPEVYSGVCSLCEVKFTGNIKTSQSWKIPICCEVCRKSKVYHAEYKRVQSNNARTRQVGSRYDLDLTEWLACIRFFDFKCAYCHTNGFTCMEHIIPVNNGGGTTLTNVLPSCYSCNSKKGGSSFIDVSREHLNKIQEWFIHASNL